MSRTKPWVIAIVAALAVSSTAFGAGGSTPSESTGSAAADQTEAATVKLQEIADAEGALGV